MATIRGKKTIEVTEVLRRICDRCGDDLPTFPDEPYNQQYYEFKLECVHGVADPDGGASEGWSVDLCPACANWLYVVLKAADVGMTEWD